MILFRMDGSESSAAEGSAVKSSDERISDEKIFDVKSFSLRASAVVTHSLFWVSALCLPAAACSLTLVNSSVSFFRIWSAVWSSFSNRLLSRTACSAAFFLDFASAVSRRFMRIRSSEVGIFSFLLLPAFALSSEILSEASSVLPSEFFSETAAPLFTVFSSEVMPSVLSPEFSAVSSSRTF